MRRLTQLSPKRNEKREHSSVGSERLPYKQRVGGSTPSAPTTRKGPYLEIRGRENRILLSGKNIPVRKACMQGKFRKFGTDWQHGSGQAVQACCAFVL